MSAASSSGMSVGARVVLGLVLVAFPLLIQIPFTVLGVTFDYPDILRRAPAEVLERFAAGGDRLVLVWYAYALCVVLFLVAVTALPEVLAASAGRRRLIRALGVITAVTQLVGLRRRTLVVPALASSYVDPSASEATRAAVVVASIPSTGCSATCSASTSASSRSRCGRC